MAAISAVRDHAAGLWQGYGRAPLSQGPPPLLPAAAGCCCCSAAATLAPAAAHLADDQHAGHHDKGDDGEPPGRAKHKGQHNRGLQAKSGGTSISSCSERSRSRCTAGPRAPGCLPPTSASLSSARQPASRPRARLRRGAQHDIKVQTDLIADRRRVGRQPAGRAVGRAAGRDRSRWRQQRGRPHTRRCVPSRWHVAAASCPPCLRFEQPCPPLTPGRNLARLGLVKEAGVLAHERGKEALAQAHVEPRHGHLR